MNLLKEILILVIGFVLLIKGADYFVEGKPFRCQTSESTRLSSSV